MSLQEFQVTNFTLFKEVELYGLEGGVFRITGKHDITSNLKTMGNNEVGKTNLLLAIVWVLLGDTVLPAGFNIKRNYNPSATTSGLITVSTTEKVVYTIERIKRQKNPLIIKQGGRSLTEMQFLEEIGAPSMTALITAIYFNINDAGLMKITQPALRMKFFEDLIDVSDLDVEQSRLKEEKQQISNRLDTNRMRIARLEGAKQTLNPIEILEAENFLKTFDGASEEERTSVKTVVARLQAEVDALQNDKIQIVRSKQQLIEAKAAETATLKAVETNLTALTGITACPTCNRDFNSPAELQTTIDGFKRTADAAIKKGTSLSSKLEMAELQYNAVIQREAGLLRQIEVNQEQHKKFQATLQDKRQQALTLIKESKEAQIDAATELQRLHNENVELMSKLTTLDYEAGQGINKRKMTRIVTKLDAIGTEVNAILTPLGLTLNVSAREMGKMGKIVLDILPGHSQSDKEVQSASGDAVFDIYQIALNKAIAKVLLPDLKLDFILMNEPLRSMSEPLAKRVTEWLKALNGTVIMVVLGDIGEIQVTRFTEYAEVGQL
jgi:hypothetical protein